MGAVQLPLPLQANLHADSVPRRRPGLAAGQLLRPAEAGRDAAPSASEVRNHAFSEGICIHDWCLMPAVEPARVPLEPWAPCGMDSNCMVALLRDATSRTILSSAASTWPTLIPIRLPEYAFLPMPPMVQVRMIDPRRYQQRSRRDGRERPIQQRRRRRPGCALSLPPILNWSRVNWTSPRAGRPPPGPSCVEPARLAPISPGSTTGAAITAKAVIGHWGIPSPQCAAMAPSIAPGPCRLRLSRIDKPPGRGHPPDPSDSSHAP